MLLYFSSNHHTSSLPCPPCLPFMHHSSPLKSLSTSSFLSSFSPAIRVCLPFLSPSHFNYSSSFFYRTLSSTGAGFHQEAWAAGERGYSGEESRGLQPALQKVYYKWHTHHCTVELNFKWALLAGPNWFNLSTCPNCILMVCFGLLFDLEGEVAGAQIIWICLLIWWGCVVCSPLSHSKIHLSPVHSLNLN